MAKQTKKVAIIIPYHKTDLSKDEQISLRHLTHFLGSYDKFLILPQSLEKPSFIIPKSTTIHFPNEYFSSVLKYCELLNTKMFYEKFTEYDYILIYQLDVLVFRDDLLKWCNKGYDYIGPPFLNSKIGFLTYSQHSPGYNGGFSLRKVVTFIKVIDAVQKTAKRKSENAYIRKLWFWWAVLTGKSHYQWLDAPAKCYPFNEDGFWSFEAPKYVPNYKVSSFEEALQFGFEIQPRKCLELNHNKLPFGCHAWARYDREFWEPFLLKP